MRVHCLQHAPFPGRAYLPEWAAREGHEWLPTLVPRARRLPELAETDALIVTGGPMSLRDAGRHPWLDAERALVAAALRADVPVLGICLGAQLLAQLLGARVLRNGRSEIGWFPIIVDEALEATWLGGVLPQQLESFFWHEDTFELPDGATPVASTRACRNQGFVWGRHLALQFHLEVTPEWAAHLARRDVDQLVADEFVQTADSILSRSAALYDRNNAVMDRLLARWLTPDPPVG